MRSLRFFLQNFKMKSLWIPSHVGILGNEMVDSAVQGTNKTLRYPINKIPVTDFLSLFKVKHTQTWQNKWTSLYANYSKWYRSITPTIPSNRWFYKLFLFRHQILLRLGHNLLPAHADHLSEPLRSLYTL